MKCLNWLIRVTVFSLIVAIPLAIVSAEDIEVLLDSNKADSAYTIKNSDYASLVKIQGNKLIGIGTNWPDTFLTLKDPDPYIKIDASETSKEHPRVHTYSNREKEGEPIFELFAFNGGNQNATGLRFTRGTDDARGNIGFYSHGEEKMLLDEKGNLGLGVSNPEGKFHQALASAVDWNNIYYDQYSLAQNRSTAVYLRKSAGEKIGERFPTTNGHRLASIMVEGVNGGRIPDWALGMAVNFTQTDEPNSSYVPVDMSIDAYDTAAHPHAVYVQHSGNVGLGTDNPLYQLHVVGSREPALVLEDTASKIRGGMYLKEDFAYVGTLDVHDLRFITDNSTKAVITQNGKVGIGTTAPETRLHVANGNITFDNSFGIHSLDSTRTKTNMVLSYDMDENTYVNAQGGGIRFQTAEQTKAVITNNGNVGIGVTTPDQYHDDTQLVIGKKDSNAGLTIATDPDRAGVVYFADGVSGNQRYDGVIIYNHKNKSMNFGTNARLTMTLDAEQNMGIGTNNPMSRLSVMNGGIAVGEDVVVGPGDIAVSGAYMCRGGNYAEFFKEGRECDLHQVVSISKNMRIAPAVNGDTFVLGIVTDRASIIGNSELAVKYPTQVKPIALFGQVKAWVSEKVEFGDWLSVGSVPGYLKKAGPGDEKIARALESGNMEIEVMLYGTR